MPPTPTLQPYALILAGGNGERFWPQSRTCCPKYLLPIIGAKPMLVQTLNRLTELLPIEHILVVTSQAHYSQVCAVCSELPLDNIIVEPLARDTAMAVGLGVRLIHQRCPTAVCGIFPADHAIKNTDAYCELLQAAYLAASEPVLVTIGIPPTYPSSGYGYIRKGQPVSTIDSNAAFTVTQFTEKPDPPTAQSYLDSGEYYWNSGMLIGASQTILNAFQAHLPHLYASLEEIQTKVNDGVPLATVLAAAYPKVSPQSLDYALLEQAENLIMLEATFDWDDVGEWTAVPRHSSPDTNGNHLKGDVVLEQSARNIVMNNPGHLTALIGVQDLIVVTTPDATLVCHQTCSQDIKKLVAHLKQDPQYTTYL